MFNDLRDFLSEAERLGEVKPVRGADWNIEIGAITELQVSRPDQPMLLFDEIKDYPPGYRVVTNFMNTSKLFALTHGLPLQRDEIMQALAASGIEPTRRAQTLSIPEWAALAQALSPA